MQLGNKLIVTANDKASVKKLQTLFKKTSEMIANWLEEQVFTTTKRTRSLINPEQANRKRGGLSTVIEESEWEFANELMNEITVSADISNCVTEIRETGPKIIFLTPGAYHAEQNFLIILAEMNLTNLAPYVAGKKRPCATCYRTLALFKHYWLKEIVYIPRGGTYFEKANEGLYKLIDIGLKQRKFTIEEIQEWLSTEIPQQYSHTSSSRSNKGKDTSSEKGETGFNSETEDGEDSSSGSESES